MPRIALATFLDMEDVCCRPRGPSRSCRCTVGQTLRPAARPGTHQRLPTSVCPPWPLLPPPQGCAYAVSIPQAEDSYLSGSDYGTVCDSVDGCVEWLLSDLADIYQSSYLLDAYISGSVGEGRGCVAG